MNKITRKSAKILFAGVMAGNLVMNLGSMVSAGSDEDATVTGKGGSLYVNKIVADYVLPTNDSWDFILDPQGLSALDGTEKLTLGAAKLQAAAGKIYSVTDKFVINNSSFDADLEIDIKLTGANYNVVAKDAVNSDKLNNVYVELKSSDLQPGVTATLAAFNGAFTREDAITQTSSELNFELDAAVYDVSAKSADPKDGYTYTVQTGSGSGFVFTLEGEVNKDADWSAFATGAAASIGVEAKFTFSQAPEVPDFVPTPYIFGNVGALNNTLEYNTIASGGTWSSGFSKTTIPVNLPNGIDIDAIKVSYNGGVAIDATADHYKYYSDVMELKFYSSTTTVDLTIILSDETEHTIRMTK